MHPSQTPPDPPRAEIEAAAMAAGSPAAPPLPEDPATGGPRPGQARTLGGSPAKATVAPLLPGPAGAPAASPGNAGQGSRASGRALGILVGILLVLSVMALL